VKFESLCVLGLGYIGLPTASTFATHGLQVIGVDTNTRIVESLNNGQIHLFEPGLRTLVQAAIGSKNLTIQNKPQKADAFIIAVPTPFKGEKLADLSYVISAAEAITPVLEKGNLVILESTSPPRTTVDIIAPILEKSGLEAGVDFFLAYSPERVLPGHILRELIDNARVIGGINEKSAQAGQVLYNTFVRGEIILTDATTAEMVKLMENTYRDINIAAANEFSRLASRFNVDIWEAIDLANRHPRVRILNPGPGVGGHCISVDPWFFVEVAPDLAQLIRTARQVNDSQPKFVVDSLSAICSNLRGKKVAALGLAYKPNVDDLRESPAIVVVEELVAMGSDVRVFEPFDTDFTIEGAETVKSLEQAIDGVEIILLLVAHTQLKEVTPENITALTENPIIFDAVNGWDQLRWKRAGYNYFRMGDGKNQS